MGQNFSGWIKIKVRGATGTSLKFRFAEMLNDNGAASRTNDGPGGSIYTYNMREAAANLNYIMKGNPEDGETYQPSTTFYGFRYCEVTTSATVEILSLTGEVVGSDIEEESAFATSHPDVNQLYSNVQWSQRANFLSIPTDCPQRDERLGWTGDTQIFARAAIYNADTRAFYHKWMGDMRASQRADGAYPDLAPYCWYGFGNAAWGDAGIIVPYTVYVMYGDKSILEENYESMTHYMDFLATQKEGSYNYIGAGTGFGDWLAYEDMDKRYVSVCYYAYVAQLMEKTSQALSETANDTYALKAQSYAALYNAIKAEFNARYVNANGTLKVTTQTAYLLALKMNLLPGETAVNRAIASLRQKIVTNGYKLSTGFVGTGTLNQTLSQYNQHDMAFNLLLQRSNPSWLYSIDQGATSIWERWDSYTLEKGFNDHSWIMNSFNHYSYGVISEWFFRTVAGIEVDETNPGFKHFILQPTPDNRTQLPQNQQRITEANATFHSAYGNITSHWTRKEDGRITYSATVPANTTATLYLPVLPETDIVTESNLPATTAEGVSSLGIANGKAVFELQSGTYEFDVHPYPASVPSIATSGNYIYPNPASDFLRITIPGEAQGNNTVTIYSLAGKSLKTQLFAFSNEINLNVSDIPKGIYFFSVQNNQSYCTQKFIKN
jgi:alpha-L-rhamnosidase